MDPIGASHTWRWYGYDNSWIVLDGALVQSVAGGAHWGGGLVINSRDYFLNAGRKGMPSAPEQGSGTWGTATT